MKNKKFFIITLLVLVFSVSQAGAQKAKSDTVCFKSNMHCAACEEAVFEQLRFEKGVKDLNVDHVSNTVKVVFAPGKNSAESLAKVIEKKGYEAKEITLAEYDTLAKAGKKQPETKDQHQH